MKVPAVSGVDDGNIRIEAGCFRGSLEWMTYDDQIGVTGDGSDGILKIFSFGY
ncbi:hypothetical protein SDC9_192618 [bioreactor metagenome]|uniref:Uncharacterized protein n=1 Tax=bioreactor metagenome TaxID=1076179 RepID=A0A645I186_9ZZZZ